MRERRGAACYVPLPKVNMLLPTLDKYLVIARYINLATSDGNIEEIRIARWQL